jgi:hypothetical protein
MKRPCPWCGVRPVVYSRAEYCSYACWASSLRVVSEEEIDEELMAALSPLREFEAELELLKSRPKTNQLDLLTGLLQSS